MRFTEDRSRIARNCSWLAAGGNDKQTFANQVGHRILQGDSKKPNSGRIRRLEELLSNLWLLFVRNEPFVKECDYPQRVVQHYSLQVPLLCDSRLSAEHPYVSMCSLEGSRLLVTCLAVT